MSLVLVMIICNEHKMGKFKGKAWLDFKKKS